MVACESSVKPLMLFHLVHARNVTNALVFTKSAESTARLVRLFEFFESALSGSSPAPYPPGPGYPWYELVLECELALCGPAS